MNIAKSVFQINDLKEIIMDYAYEPKTHEIYEGDMCTSMELILLKARKYDKVSYLSYNQLGCMIWEVRLNEKKEKYLHLIWSAEDEYYDC